MLAVHLGEGELKALIKRLINAIHLDGFAKRIRRIASDIIREIARTDQRIINDYFDSTQIRKLHIGCGQNILNGWLNSDYLPRSKRILRLDATKKFPFENDEFDNIFSEHMIEHLSYQDGGQMLSECFRVLRPKGKVRISTPDMSFLIALYGSDKSELQVEFMRHSAGIYEKQIPHCEDTFVINNFMRAWGHTFIYDEKTLRHLMDEVGFVDIEEFNVSESRDDVLQNLENVLRKPTGLIGLESLVLEGTKR